MIGRKLAFPAGAQKSVLSGFGHASRRWRFNLEKRNSLDRDARAYIEKAGVKNEQGRQQISDYVRGLKSLGWWGLLVSFPLRFQQNAPAGSTLYSLGLDFEGEENFTATINGTPTRSSQGMIFPAVSNFLNLSRHLIADTAFWVGGCAQTTGSGQIFIQDDDVMRITCYVTGNLDLLIYPSDLNNSYSDIPNLSNFSTGLGFFQFTGLDDVFTAKKNLSSLSSSDFEAASIGRSGGSIIGNIQGTMPFFFFGSAIAPDNDQQNKFYSLYKSTLGQGLGLP